MEGVRGDILSMRQTRRTALKEYAPDLEYGLNRSQKQKVTKCPLELERGAYILIEGAEKFRKIEYFLGGIFLLPRFLERF